LSYHFKHILESINPTEKPAVPSEQKQPVQMVFEINDDYDSAEDIDQELLKHE